MGKKFTEFAIALSGGGARGIVHAGFLKAMDEAGLRPAAISGTSMGAIVGAMYAGGVAPQKMLESIHLPGFFTLPSWIGLKGGLGSLDVLRQQLEIFIGNDSFEQLEIPLIVSVTNLNTAKNELLSSGNLYDAVVASASIPIVFVPVKIGKYYYVDGGLTVNLPIKCLRKPGRLVVGINSNHIEEEDNAFQTMRMVGERCLFIAVQNTLRDEVSYCDVLIDPPEARLYSTFEFDKATEIFDIGYMAGLEYIPKIKEFLKN
jgi:NTE family protein